MPQPSAAGQRLEKRPGTVPPGAASTSTSGAAAAAAAAAAPAGGPSRSGAQPKKRAGCRYGHGKTELAAAPAAGQRENTLGKYDQHTAHFKRKLSLSRPYYSQKPKRVECRTGAEEAAKARTAARTRLLSEVARPTAATRAQAAAAGETCLRSLGFSGKAAAAAAALDRTRRTSETNPASRAACAHKDKAATKPLPTVKDRHTQPRQLRKAGQHVSRSDSAPLERVGWQNHLLGLRTRGGEPRWVGNI